LQITSAISNSVDIPLPQMYTEFMAMFKIVNLDMVPWQSLDCVSKLSIVEKIIIASISPVITICVLFAIFHHCNWKKEGNFNADGTTTRARHQKRANFVKLSFFTLFLLYPGLSQQILSYFLCVEVEGVYYLQTDMTEECYTDTWWDFVPLAVFFTLLYPVGILILIVFTLRYFHSRHMLGNPKVRQAFGILYSMYSNDMWFFETVDMMYKLTMSSLVAFIPEIMTRLRVAVCLGYFFLAITLLTSPYIRVNDDRLQVPTLGQPSLPSHPS